MSFAKEQDLPVEKPALVAKLHGAKGGEEAHYRFRIFAGVSAVEWRREAKPGQAVPGDSTLLSLEAVAEDPPGFSSVHLQDHTDRHGKKDNLVKVTDHALGETGFEAAANVGYVEGGGGGLTLVKMGPLPHARALKGGADFLWDGKALSWRGPGVNPVAPRATPDRP